MKKKPNSVCLMCGLSFELTSRRKRLYCAECLPIRKAQINVKMHRDNPNMVRGLKNYAMGMRGKNNPHTTGERHYKWKGDEVGIDALHFWVMRHKPDPGHCEHCGTTDEKLEWSNISQEYKRDLDDFQRLCRSCHLKYDNKMGVRNGNQKALHSGVL